ncbi:hypothetical protein [Sulfurimonas sp.]|uniref:hypothetical protein n=1 Tax=Sulfurimonas sp. TaxID=2022749 RepID=UPI00262BB7BC|nr:hypothetical protein [Sulfurimonas sp.]
MCKIRLSAILLLLLVEGIGVVNAQEKTPINKALVSSEYSQKSIAPQGQIPPPPPQGQVPPPPPQGQVPPPQEGVRPPSLIEKKAPLS